MDRRHFLKLSALAGGSLLLNACTKNSSAAVTVPGGPPLPNSNVFFTLHPFVDAHPEAVFIKRTGVSAKTDSDVKQQEGRALAREIFRSGGPGTPLSNKIAIKPNLTCSHGQGNTPQGMGILTDRHFMQGLVEGMQGVGFQASNIYMREGNWLSDGYCSSDIPSTDYTVMAGESKIHLLDMPSGRRLTDLTLGTLQEGTEVVWKDCPDGVVFKRIGYVAPFNQEDTFLLNVAKFKAHGMGMSLSVKNLQGMCVSPHVHFCEGVDATLAQPASVLKDFQPTLEENIAKLHAQHLKAGFSRWAHISIP